MMVLVISVTLKSQSKKLKILAHLKNLLKLKKSQKKKKLQRWTLLLLLCKSMDLRPSLKMKVLVNLISPKQMTNRRKIRALEILMNLKYKKFSLLQLRYNQLLRT